MVEQVVSSATTETLGFFDLSDSTSMKLVKGHSSGTKAALEFVVLASKVVDSCDGTVLKELGDGILCRFGDPLRGCQAALNLKAACDKLGISASLALTIGRVTWCERPGRARDVFGHAVDRCARIQELAHAGQVLIDEPLYEVVQSHLTDYSDVVVSDILEADAKGIGHLELRELSMPGHPFLNRLMTPFTVHPGRPPLHDRVRFLLRAKQEVIEIGTGLTAMAKYFSAQRSTEYRNHVVSLLESGVTVRCYALDADYELGLAYLRERGETDYASDIRRAQEMLISERRRALAAECPGRLHYYHYRLIPDFHCICIDPVDTLNAAIRLSPYLHGSPRAEAPVYEVSRQADASLFGRYLRAIRSIQSRATEVRQ